MFAFRHKPRHYLEPIRLLLVVAAADLHYYPLAAGRASFYTQVT